MRADLYDCPMTRFRLPALLLLMPASLAAQAVPVAPSSNPATLLGINALIGGTSAAAHALIARRNPARAFALGAVGGAIHYSGKRFVAQAGTVTNLGGMGLASLGTAVVANAGAGAGPLDELFVAVGPVRTRMRLGSRPRVSFSVNLYETVVALHGFTRAHQSVDWDRSAATGTFVFVTENRFIVTEGDTADGAATGAVVVLSGLAGNPDRTMRHEAVHVHQHWFMQEAWGRPLEAWVRRSVRYGDRIPAWLDLGVIPPAYHALEVAASGRFAPLANGREAEAAALTP